MSTTSDTNVVLAPVEELVFTGLQKQFKQVFNCPFYPLQSTGRKAMLQKIKGNPSTPTKYPFGFITMTGLGPIEDAYSVKAMVLNGTQVFKANDNKSYRATIMPVQLTCSIEFYTNSARAMLAYANTWMFAPKIGMLHFNVNYGQTSFPIQVTPSNSLSMPTREDELDAVQEYIVTGEITVRSFLSRSELLETEIAARAEIAIELTEPNELKASDSNSAFWSFNREQEPSP